MPCKFYFGSVNIAPHTLSWGLVGGGAIQTNRSVRQASIPCLFVVVLSVKTLFFTSGERKGGGGTGGGTERTGLVERIGATEFRGGVKKSKVSSSVHACGEVSQERGIERFFQLGLGCLISANLLKLKRKKTPHTHKMSQAATRNIHTSPAVISLERVMAGFRARSQLLVSRLEDSDDVCIPEFTTDSSDSAPDDPSPQPCVFSVSCVHQKGQHRNTKRAS